MRKLVFGALFILLLMVALDLKLPAGIQPIMSLSVSSDGRYVISAHRGKQLYLWDIEQQTRKKIAEEVNLYSAYFMPDRDAFMWQNLDRTVIIQTVEGQELRRFALDHDVYGHIMNLERDTYVSADAEYTVRAMINGKETQLKAPGGSFAGYFKVLNLSLSSDASLLLTAGSSNAWPITMGPPPPVDFTEQEKLNNYARIVGVALWSLETLGPVARLYGNQAKTHASISPNGQWVVSGDENGIGRFWNTDSPEEHFTNSSYYHGLYRGQDEEGNTRPRDLSGFIPPPQRISVNTVATSFIQDNQYYLHLTYTGASERDSYAVLFETGNPWPIQYFDLGTDPWPSTREYSRNLTIATAPEAGILVTGQHSKGGINVYQFDAENLTLERIWVGR